MKCGLCRESGHNQKTCPQGQRAMVNGPLSRSTPDELMRLLIDPGQALALVEQGNAAEALASATRRIGDLQRDGLGHLICTDILTALAELDLRARSLPEGMAARIGQTRDAVEIAKQALAAAEHEHTRAKAEVLIELGYREKAESMGFRVALVDAEASA